MKLSNKEEKLKQFRLGLDMAKDACTEFVLKRYGRCPPGRDVTLPLMLFLYWNDEGAVFKWAEDESTRKRNVHTACIPGYYFLYKGIEGIPKHCSIPARLGKLEGKLTEQRVRKRILLIQIRVAKQQLIKAAEEVTCD
jgi:hypothetical protein